MAIQMDEVRRIAESTTQEFKDNCNHEFEKEYHLGTATGDDGCRKCGETRIRRVNK